MFALVGETLRRIRKERSKTLEELGKDAGLGRGQLSRIENARQEATLSTLAKILHSQGVSRKEFFRRYDLAENEIVAARSGEGREPEPGEALAADPQGGQLGAIQGFFGNFGAFFRHLLQQSGPVAQGAVEVGDLTVLFQVVPRSPGAPPLAHSVPEPPPAEGAKPDETPRPRRGRPAAKGGPRRPARRPS